MATQVQWRGGSTAEHATFTGAAREVTVDTQKKTLVVHDGSTAGGEPLLREDQANLPSSVTNGLSVPSANNVALSTNSSGRIHIGSTGTVNIVGAGTAGSTQAVSFNGSAPVNSLVLTSAGLVGIGTGSPGALLSLAGSSAYTVGNSGRATQGLDVTASAGGAGLFGGAISFGVGGTGRASISAVQGSADSDVVGLTFNIHNSGTAAVDAVEAMRIDGSGRLLVGTASASTTGTAVFQGNSGGATSHGIINIGRGATNPGVNLSLGFTQFQDAAGSVGAQIYAQTDAAWSSGSYAGRLVFSTTADGASSPTPRLTIKSTGIVNIANAPTYADNAAATTGGLAVGDVYQTSTGQLMIRY